MSSDKLPMIAIVGRPNVGKSALFNALLRRRVSIVHEEAGVTRDVVMSRCNWAGRDFLLVDTGGLGVMVREKNVSLFDGLIREQVLAVAQEASLLIMVVDVRDGITPQDREVAAFVRTTGCEVILAVNKSDNPTYEEDAETLFGKLGFQRVIPTSCIQKTGLNTLMECCLGLLPGMTAAPEPENELKLAVIGRPNVGKSSLVNTLIGERRVMVSDVAGTTRDAIDIPLMLETNDGEKVPVMLVDTAGLRKKSSVDTMVDYFSMMRTERAMARADVVLFVVDCQDAGTGMDRKIAHSITELGKPCIIIANKWDKMMEDKEKREGFVEFLRENMSFMAHAPILQVSALTGYRVSKIADCLLALRGHMKTMIPTSIFNRFLQDVTMRTPPPTVKGRRLKIYYGTMASNPPAKFVIFINSNRAVADHYVQFLENRLREAFFPESGLPIVIEMREREDPKGRSQQGNRAAAVAGHKEKETEYQRKKRYHDRRKGFRDS